ncbi:MAG: hypothetical protein HZB26_11405 [Candidatus Hydrogenedentes bacterium]|nr:hypothetical protein [Candidatus Hydrogenedentota bacterium]
MALDNLQMLSGCAASISRLSGRTPRTVVWLLIIVVFTLAGFGGACQAEAAEAAAPPGETPAAEELEADAENSGWFGILGAMNYHTHLDESERVVNREMNGVFGRVLPSWQEPTTFKDWSEDWKLWDLYLGAGKDIALRWSWQATTGAGIGFISNSKRYRPLGFPLKIDVDFERADVFVETGVNYYPWEKPVFKSNSAGILGILRSTRPYLSLVGGYTWQHAVGDVTARLPLAGRLLHIKQEDEYNLLYVFPRVCLETPISAKDSINVMAGYLAFDDHASEFNSVTVGVFLKHRF